jgi:hypothetical protein
MATYLSHTATNERGRTGKSPPVIVGGDEAAAGDRAMDCDAMGLGM